MALRSKKDEGRQDFAYGQIRQAIINGVYQSEQHLSEPELALTLQVSRTPLREAFVRLEQDGFVMRSSTGRVLVARLDISELEQLYTVRSTLEELATRLAASRLRTIDLDEMAAIIKDVRKNVETGDFLAAINGGEAFHKVIIRECANAPLVLLLSHLHGRIHRYRSMVAGFSDYDIDRIHEHERILDALYRRCADEAATEMARHIARSAAVLIAKLRARERP